MNILSIVLSLLLIAPPAWSQTARQSAPEISISTAPTAELAPLVITAPWLSAEETRHLKEARAVGGLAAVSATGVIIYSVVVASAGPIAWAAGLLFVGGLTAYLSHRRLKGHDDFSSETQAQTASNAAR
ncbi:MAG TPA: hypothetical protein VNK24_08400 [Elusimicrobiota bacterium]|nr:hypothetical protein [Elusimicrobiota bacterium]